MKYLKKSSKNQENIIGEYKAVALSKIFKKRDFQTNKKKKLITESRCGNWKRKCFFKGK